MNTEIDPFDTAQRANAHPTDCGCDWHDSGNLGPLERAWQMAKGAMEDVQRERLKLQQLEAKAQRAADEFAALVAQHTGVKS